MIQTFCGGELHVFDMCVCVCVHTCVNRFNGDPGGLLIASDVAARGLDFPHVEHVIHYQVPMNTEVRLLGVVYRAGGVVVINY